MEEKLYKIEQPDISQVDLEMFRHDCYEEIELIEKTESPQYLHWKDIKYKNWIPKRFDDNKQHFWALIKCNRKIYSAKTPIRNEKGEFFTWQKLSRYEKMLHHIDLDMSKYLLNFSEISQLDHKKYQIQGIMEEAIASSQLEGAHSTRKVAKKMIIEKSIPKTFSEKMIFNNFSTMKIIQEKYKNDKLSLDILLDMHQMLTKDTMKELEQGKLRKNEDKIVIMKGDDPLIISYVAPSIEFVHTEITRLISFANDELEEDRFIHPIIKAIMLHFWIGFLHPFVDGNGRLARSLFYWYLLRQGYWAFAFLPISLAIKNSPSKYSEAYILSEQDDSDLTYFIDYHLRKINQSADDFKKYFAKKSQEKEKTNKILQNYKNLNTRQIEVLRNLCDNPNQSTTLTAHKNIFSITKITAIKDLKGLVSEGFVYRAKRGRNVFYWATQKLNEIKF